ncbi:MAG: hypothetical protein IKX18_05965 [Muribaculaceae bacterium]|nr:hypothetical protein [Muribaculaceae bacterium]
MKKFLIQISYTVLPVWLLLVGLAFYLWVTNDNSGDLMRLGLIDSGPEYADSIGTQLLPEVYYTGVEDDRVLRSDTCDVLVIGDSFSHGGGMGKKGDYVNYLAHQSGRKVVVFTPQDPTLSSPMQVAYDVLNLGCIDSTNVKNLVVEEVERYLVDRHSSFVTTHTTIPRPEPSAKEASDKPQIQETGPLMRVKDYIFYHLFGANPIYTLELSRPVFGGVEPTKLYFYNEEVKLGFDVTADQQRKVIDCYDKVIELARQKGVNLVLILACDKYDLYQDCAASNPYPVKTLNEDVEQWMAPERDCFVFTKRIFLPLVQQGVRDVYLFNDTHWSPSSSSIIAGEVIKKLQ